jgi:FkbM family methyltransferase
MNDLRSRFGRLRSELIYVWKPFSRRRLRRFYRQFVHLGALSFDVGAHLGSRSRAFLDLGARVIALEPQPQCGAYLQKRWGDARRFTLIPKAIGVQPGIATLHINRMNPTISTLAPDSWRRTMAAAAWKDLKSRPLPVCPIRSRRCRLNSSASERPGHWRASGG